jgi:hypothetical protein
MSSDIEFLRQRLALVKRELAQPDVYQHRARQPVRQSDLVRRRLAYQRQARLLQKLLAQARPGGVLHMLTAWRQAFSQYAKEYRTRHKEAIRAYDEWSEMPPHVRNQIAMPPKPPAPRFCDQNGAPWIVDDGLFVVIDGLIEQLRKWQEEGAVI